MTEIPSSIFFTSWNISSYSTYLYYNDEGPLFNYRLGIQAHYTIDGVKNSSDIVYLEFAPLPDTGVDELMNNKQIAEVCYFNLSGQEVAQPSGLTIQVTTYTDVTRSATKVLK